MATKDFIAAIKAMGTLNILGTRYWIEFIPRRWVEFDSPGSVNFPLGRISLDRDLDNGRILEILLHEIGEVIVDRFTVTEYNHTSLCCIEFGITETFRRNPKLVRVYLKYLNDCRGNYYAEGDFPSGTAVSPRTASEIAAALEQQTQEAEKKKPQKKKSHKGRKGKKATRVV